MDGIGRGLGDCVDWVDEEEGSPSESFDRLGFGTRFGESCLGMSFSSSFSHLERFLEGVEDPARVGSIEIVGHRTMDSG